MREKLHVYGLFFILLTLVQGCSHSITFLPLPDVQQETSYSCGAAAAKSILFYYGIDSTESQIARAFGTSEISGTSPDHMINGFHSYGLEVTIKENATLDDIMSSLKNAFPAMVAIQAWLENYPPLNWDSVWEDGHWLIVIGMDESNVYFEDPSLFGPRGYLTREEFIMRWHDYVGTFPCCDIGDKKYNHLMITVKGTPIQQYQHVN